jgi:hypothetical protein
LIRPFSRSISETAAQWRRVIFDTLNERQAGFIGNHGAVFVAQENVIKVEERDLGLLVEHSAEVDTREPSCRKRDFAFYTEKQNLMLVAIPTTETNFVLRPHIV